MKEQLKTQDLDALVLAGGESKRMGLPKASLPLGRTTLIGTVIDILRPLFHRVLVVARDNQAWAELDVEVLTDDRLERGPLAGLARGLAASDALWCFVVGCDMPFLRPAVILRMAEHLDQCDILAPYLEGRFQTLHAFYGKGCLPCARELLDDGITSLQALLSCCRTKTVVASNFFDLDPHLLSFRDLDTPEDYLIARQQVQGFQQQKVDR